MGEKGWENELKWITVSILILFVKWLSMQDPQDFDGGGSIS